MTELDHADNETTENNLQPAELRQPPFYRAWFINRFDNKRAGWRFVLYLVVAAGLAYALGWILKLVLPELNKDGMINASSLTGNLVVVASMSLAGLIMLRWFDKRPVDLLGISLTPGWFREFGLGLALGFGLLTTIAAVLWAGGLMEFQVNPISMDLIGKLVLAFFFFFLTGALEELLMRGYTYQSFIEGSRVWIATIVLSSIFAILHMTNPDFSGVGALNIFLAGLLLSVAYLKTRSLWLPTGLHMAWNWTQGSYWGMGVSGYHVQWSLFSATPQGNDLLSGGTFGPEASIIATVIIGALTWWLWRTNLIAPSSYMQSLWQKYPGGYGIPPVDDGTDDA